MSDNQKIKGKSQKKDKKENEAPFYILQYGVISVCILIMLFEIIIMISAIFSKSSTINLFGNKLYICAYNDQDMDFKYGDLIIAKDFDREDNYNDFVGMVYKPDSRQKDTTILKRRNYEVLKTYQGSIQGKVVSKHEKLGLVFLFIRNLLVVTFVAIVIVGVYTIYMAIRRKYDDNSRKRYLRRIKDVCVLITIALVYISTLYIRQVVNYSTLKDNSDIPNMDEKPDIDDKPGGNEGNPKPGNTTEGNGETQKPEENIPENPPVQGDFNIVVTDNKGTWNQNKRLDVFKNDYFKDTSKIAPGVSGKYEFQVQNKSVYDVDYKVNIAEKNEHNVNLLYRIQRNGQFIDDGYKRITEYSKIEEDLNSKETDTYTIYWKWFDAENDTEVGTNAENVEYILNFSIIATQK